MASRVLDKFRQKLAGFELIPSGGGCFELTVDNELVYSKLATGEFPDEEIMVSEIGKRLAKRK